MHWKVVISPAGAEAAGMSDPSDWADLLSPNTDLLSAVPPEDGRCPRCHRHAVECLWQIFADEPATTPDQITGPIFVMCLCRNLYRYAGVHAVDTHQPIGQASVRADSVSRTPGTGALQIDGQDGQPVVLAPSRPEPLPPGANNTLDAANQVVHITYEHRRRFHAPFITPPFGPTRARNPLPETATLGVNDRDE